MFSVRVVHVKKLCLTESKCVKKSSNGTLCVSYIDIEDIKLTVR